MRIVHDRARVRVPATSGNCGPGFDSIGMAHDVWDDVSATLTTGASRVTILGEGAKELPKDDEHLIVRVMHETMERFGLPQAGIELICRNSIQQGKGLGSSAAAIVAGLMLIAGLTGGLNPDDPHSPDLDISKHDIRDSSLLTKSALLDIAAEYEGHPDNAAPCLYGGATLSWYSRLSAQQISAENMHNSTVDVSTSQSEDSFDKSQHRVGIGSMPRHVQTVALNVHPHIQTSLLVPADILSTQQARAVLPQAVPHADASFQAARSALLVRALEHNPDLIYDATEDRLHQDYRADSMPRTAALLEALRDAGWPAVISGAGPSILLFANVDTPLAQVITAQGFQVVDSRQVSGAELL